MTRDELEAWCATNGVAPDQRNLGKQAPDKVQRNRLTESTTGKVVAALREASAPLKMKKSEAVAKLQRGLTEYAKRELRRTETTEFLRQRTIDDLPQVELQDVDTSTDDAPMILLPRGRGE